jgi:hypothetical protein
MVAAIKYNRGPTGLEQLLQEIWGGVTEAQHEALERMQKEYETKQRHRTQQTCIDSRHEAQAYKIRRQKTYKAEQKRLEKRGGVCTDLYKPEEGEELEEGCASQPPKKLQKKPKPQVTTQQEPQEGEQTKKTRAPKRTAEMIEAAFKDGQPGHFICYCKDGVEKPPRYYSSNCRWRSGEEKKKQGTSMCREAQPQKQASS